MSKLGSVSVGGTSPIRIMGVINTSPESFYKRSIRTTKSSIADAACMMEEQGADIIDIGGMSTAPYLDTIISEKKESKRLTDAIKAVQSVSNLPISADTCRAGVARAALELGVEIINDVTGLKYDRAMADTIGRFESSVILCAYGKTVSANPAETKRLLRQSISMAKKIPHDKITLDPAIGFFRSGSGRFFSHIQNSWVTRDLDILYNLQKIKHKFPIMVSVSRKSFLGAILNQEPKDRTAGSLACEMLAAISGADVIRTHDVQESRQVAKTAQRLVRSGRRAGLATS